MNTDPPLVTVHLDDHDHTVPANTTLAALVDSLGHQPQAVTTAVNGRFVPRNERHAHPLRSGDAVLLFQPIVGG
jgi:sulfur carrier protein